MSLTEAHRKKIEEEERFRAKIRHQYKPRSPRNKTVAALLAIFLGGIGIHKFYMGETVWGVIYLLFCWLWIPAIVGFIEGICYLVMSEEKFQSKT